jgi:hypothetical protein
LTATLATHNIVSSVAKVSRGKFEMSVNLAIDFDWSRGRSAYEIVAPALRRAKGNPFAAKVDEPHIRQIGAAFDVMRPLEAHPSLFMDFAKLNGSGEACADFARKWGLLERRADAGGVIQERLSVWRQRIEIMRLSIKGLRRAFEEKHPMAMRGENIAPLDLKLVPGKLHGRPTLALQPETLWWAMRVQLAQNIAGGNTFHECQRCGAPFVSGPTAKRVIARFCTDYCRKRFHYDQRRVEK